jgi:hypothetical protein
MIQMPRRSVTRFFIPLIDVMTLLFCIFLLMPVFKEADPENPDNIARKATAKKLQDLTDRIKELEEELARLRAREKSPVQQRLAIRVLEVDPDKGGLFYYEPGRPPRRHDLKSAEEAQTLIKKQKRELAREHPDPEKRPELHYLFVLPRVDTAFPEGRQLKEYQRWFAEISHSIDRPWATP